MDNKTTLQATVTIEAIPENVTDEITDAGCFGCMFYNLVPKDCNRPYDFAHLFGMPECKTEKMIYVVTELKELEEE
jgi:hypothetical protein